MSWCGNFVKMQFLQSFGRIARKKFPHQKIRQHFGILHGIFLSRIYLSYLEFLQEKVLLTYISRFWHWQNFRLRDGWLIWPSCCQVCRRWSLYNEPNFLFEKECNNKTLTVIKFSATSVLKFLWFHEESLFIPMSVEQSQLLLILIDLFIQIN